MTILLSSLTKASTDNIDQPIRIGSYITPGIMESDGTGLLNKLNNAVLKEMGIEAELTLTSIKRVRKEVAEGRLDAYFPELWENLDKDRNQYITSNPFFYKRIILFTLKGSNITKLSDFESELLGVVKGFSYGTQIKSNKKLNLIYQKDDMTNIKLLLNKRIGGVLGGYPATILAIKSNDYENRIHYSLDNPVAILESFYVCKNDQKGRQLCDKINLALDSLIQKGILELNHTTGLSRFNQLN